MDPRHFEPFISELKAWYEWFQLYGQDGNLEEDDDGYTCTVDRYRALTNELREDLEDLVDSSTPLESTSEGSDAVAKTVRWSSRG